MKITHNDIVNALDNLNSEARVTGADTKYSINAIGAKYSIRIREGRHGVESNAVGETQFLTTREAFFALCGLLKGRQQQAADRNIVVFGRSTRVLD